jgi:hypothetical protein
MPQQPRAQTTRRKGKRAASRRSLWSRLWAWLSRPLKRARRTGEQQQPPNKAAAALARLRRRKSRTLAEWKELRRRNTTAVRAHLDAQEPIPAIKKLTLAILEDPQHEAYHDLLRKAVEQRHRRRLSHGDEDPWAGMAKDLRAEVVKLEALSAYVDELERLLDEAGVPPLVSPARSGKQQQNKKKKNQAAKREHDTIKS